ncbi:multidrug MFS transporter [Geothrix limicola]|uniref:Multidrug MFS transporter n=1 Tax=Geothrix limicola TaxID=2927978 RepID=A0ABQ5QGD0_9BACT|nr:ERCC4 domain-containing protein [Geothrix limicola]GLH73733.1 multidrug MFS transporter [Geothrix limicola]
MDDPIRIWMDDREARGSGIANLFADMKDVSLAVKRLRVGDYVIEGKAVLERKRVPDFLGSLFDGRLFAQAKRLADSPLRAFLILEGPASEWTHRHIQRESVQGAMLTLSVVFGIPVLRSQGEEETARLIRYTARQLQATSSAPPKRPGRRPVGKGAIQLRVLTSFPRIGSKRALRLIEHFGTLEHMMAATCAELAAVPGIGKRTAQSIHWAVHEDSLPYRV